MVTLTPAPGIEAVLRKLRNDNISMAAVSNAPFSGRVLTAELEKHGLGHFFRFVLSSADLGFRKPHSAIFETALLRLGVSSERSWFVGDTCKEDILGASRAGLRAILLSSDDFEQPLDPPFLRVRDWSEFMDVYDVACQSGDPL